MPASARPYARLARFDRPIGWWLLLLPCWWSSALASASIGQFPVLLHYGLFLIGAMVMRGAGSTWNDIVDRELDKGVARTRGRPIPSGAVTARQAAVFMAVLGLAGLAVLLAFERFTVLLGLASLAPVVVYPYMKRITNYPQIMLGIAFAWGGLMGWAGIRSEVGIPALLLYAAAIAWTIGYDTIYALQDIEDDPGVGIGSTALASGRSAPQFIALWYLLASGLVGTAVVLAAPGFFALAGVLAFAAHLAWQILALKLDDPALALRLFRSNRNAGLLLSLGLFAEAVQRAL